MGSAIEAPEKIRREEEGVSFDKAVFVFWDLVLGFGISICFWDCFRVRLRVIFSWRAVGCVLSTSQRELNTKAEKFRSSPTNVSSVASASDSVQISSRPIVSSLNPQTAFNLTLCVILKLIEIEESLGNHLSRVNLTLNHHAESIAFSLPPRTRTPDDGCI